MPGKRPRVSEKAEQTRGILLLRTLGAKVYILGTRRRRGDYQGTCQTAGVPDVLAFLPVRGETSRRMFLAWECKAVGGRLRPAQREFQDLCADAAITHVTGSCDVLIAWLASLGFVKADPSPHYRDLKVGIIA